MATYMGRKGTWHCESSFATRHEPSIYNVCSDQESHSPVCIANWERWFVPDPVPAPVPAPIVTRPPWNPNLPRFMHQSSNNGCESWRMPAVDSDRFQSILDNWTGQRIIMTLEP